MRYLSRHAASPEESFSEFLRWIKRSGGHLPSILAKPAKVDVKMIDLYFKRFSLPWPFFAVIDLEKTYAFVSHRNNLKELHVEDHRRYEHNALEDSIYQAEQYAAVLNIQKLALEKFFTNKNRNHHS
jgi:hypothetical protein